MSSLKDFKINALNGSQARRIVVFLHGLGDRGDGGLLELGQIWAPQLPDCAFHCPDAPFVFDMAPPDFGGRQWFSLQNHDPSTMLKGTEQAAPLLDQYIDELLAQYALTPDRLALVGFSQGTMMALYTALRRKPSLAGVVGYSGALIGGELLTSAIQSTPPVLLIHGTADDVVPFAAQGAAEQALRAHRVPVTTLACPGVGHTIDDSGLRAGVDFLLKIWP